MKAFLLLAIVLSVKSASIDKTLLGEWTAYKEKFQKHYAAHEEDHLRMMQFNKTRHIITEHNLKYLAGEATYKMGITQFSDMSVEEIESFLCKMDSTPKGNVVFNTSPDLKVPDEINWVNKGAVTPVRNQENCGSCYAFGPIASLEGRNFITNHELIVLSPQNIVDCSYSYSNSGCVGGSSNSTFEYIIDYGINTESCYPYTAKAGDCHFNRSCIAVRMSEIVQVPEDEEKLKAAVASGPVNANIYASLTSFLNYRSGVYADGYCNIGFIDHSIAIVGYGRDSKTNMDYWLIKNSWGTAWGENGYMRLARNYENMCLIASMAMFPVVVKKSG